MKRGIAVLLAFLLVLSAIPFAAISGNAQTDTSDVQLAQQSSELPNTTTYTTGRSVDDVSVQSSDGRLSLLVSDDNPTGTPLILNRSWLRSELGKPVTFMRFQRQGELVESYKFTSDSIIVDIPHFSTQNVTVTTVDGQFRVNGSASGQTTTRVINYDVNETGIAILEVHGQGTREGAKRVDQFYSQVDNGTFQWETGEIPRNTTLRITGEGERLGPLFNRSTSGVSNGQTVFFDLAAKDYKTNLTVTGARQRNGTRVEKGVYRGDGDGDARTLTYQYLQNNGSVVFTGNTSGGTQNYQDITTFNPYPGPGSYVGDQYWSGNVNTSGGSLSITNGNLVSRHEIDDGSGNPITVDGRILAQNITRINDGIAISAANISTGELIAGSGSEIRVGGSSGNTNYREGYVISEGPTDLSGNPTIYGTYIHNDTSDASLGGGSIFEGDIYSRGDITNVNGAEFYGDVWVDGDFAPNTFPTVNGEVYATGSGGTQSITQQEFENAFPSEKVNNIQSVGSRTKTQDPEIDINGDGTAEASYTGILNDSETVVVEITENVSDGTQTWTVHTNGGSIVDWKYDGNNEARSHVKNISLNGVNYPVNEFLAADQNITLNISRADTLQGENSLTLTTYTDTETTHVSRLDVQGRYEGRTVVDNYTVNGVETDLDRTLADGETTTTNISSEAVYGTNNITLDLRENSTQENYDAEIVWYPENRTYFTNVTVNGVTYGSPTFLGADEILVLNVTDEIGPGANDHVFRMQSEKTTTDTLDFTEKVEFYKNVSVEIEEKHATYNKSTTETFDKPVTAGARFNFSIPDRVMRHSRTKVVYNNSEVGVLNTTTVENDQVSVRVDEEIPQGTTVTVAVELLTYRVNNATDILRAENTLSAPYKVDVGVRSVTGNVTFETVEPAFSAGQYEVILTRNGEPFRETNATFRNGNISVPESRFNSSVSGFIVQRPQYSTVTYTGTVNTIYPTARIEPNRTVTHDPVLYTEPDESYTRIENYSVRDLNSPVSVEWTQVGAYHLQWMTNETQDSQYNQTIENVTGEGVSVFADGDRHQEISREQGDLVIHTNQSATWDVYQYDFPQVVSNTNVSVGGGETQSVQVTVRNPNEFALHDVQLKLEHGWIESVEPTTQDIPSGESVTFNVTLHVPAGTQSTTYTLPMNVTSVETGEVGTKDLRVAVGGGIITRGGLPVSRFALLVGGVVLLIALVLYQMARSGQLSNLRKELEKI